MSLIHDPSDPKRINDVVDQLIEEHAKDRAKHIVKKLTMDEIVIYDAMDLYDAVEKHPATGELHRQHAADLLARLDKCTDECMVQMAQEGAVVGQRDNMRSCFIHMARLTLKRRGIQMANRMLRN